MNCALFLHPLLPLTFSSSRHVFHCESRCNQRSLPLYPTHLTSRIEAFHNDSFVGSDNGTVDAEITTKPMDFFVSDAEGDPDCPTNGYSSIEQALDTLRRGKYVMVVDEENEEMVQGKLVMAACFTSSNDITFMLKHGSGIVSVGMKKEDLDRLRLPPQLMSPRHSSSASTFTVTVDVKSGTSTGVSASERAKTVTALSSADSKPRDFTRPGHVFPLKYQNGGVLRRAGHTEASVDLVMLAGLRPISLLSALVDPRDRSMLSLLTLKEFALQHNIPIVTIRDLIRYRTKPEKLVERSVASHLTTKWGLFQSYCYRSKLDGTEHIVLVKLNLLASNSHHSSRLKLLQKIKS